MSTPTKYCDSTIPELYKSALMPPDLSLETYKVLEKEWGTAKKDMRKQLLDMMSERP